MIPAWHLSWRSILNRRLTVALTVVSVALSVSLLLGVERLRNDARAGFAQTIAGTDLVVGARSGPVQLLLYTVFHIGNPTNNISWDSVEQIAAHPQVDWLVPISLGDSHRGFRVVGTSSGYFEHYRYGRNRSLNFAEGEPFARVFDAVLGAEVAARFGYAVGQEIILSHGAGAGVSFAAHDDKPFTIVGVLARTGTPVDRSVLVSLEGIEAIHLGWQGGAPIPGLRIAPEQVHRFDLAPKSVTAALVGLKSRTAIFQVQRHVNTFRDEPLLAVLPGATLQELWGLIGMAEKALLAVSALVVLVGLAGLVAVVTASLGERRRELAILRSLGAGPRQIFLLLALESLVLSLLGCLGGLALLYGTAAAIGPWLEAHYGLLISLGWPAPSEWRLLGAVVGAALLASLVPALRAYRYSLADGMTLRI
ncbi:putative ABC transport system permease protein [Geoalkalibacter ferrihydriticus]|uniref:Peptide ABC transporter permease n=2 Tax=Geoalkalibacter ferrihydriticus TaxID=392333 RepID=A0A0C2HLQ0_9BACT|nr:FtsX-like permease family protein [Geoalkalibacter ferrihydriticus]KIH75920.1 peptide ABC transporter permease [Geoalkalibacter ferrihydriticus DSM 17813]SDM55386.1 putative ABC transport system permease protein [Geoalkalibacter ferrihydriticus]